MNIAICDDTQKDIDFIQQSLNHYSEEHHLPLEASTFHCAEELLADNGLLSYSCVILDIYMKNLTGMDCARTLRERGYQGSLIFTTTSKEHVFESFLVDVLDYLVKPFDYHRFSIALDKLVKQHVTELEYFQVLSNGKNVMVPVCDITYIETSSHCSILHTISTTIRTSTAISELENQLKQYHLFLRSHRSFLVNMNHITYVGESTLTVTTGETILLSIRNLSSIKQQISHYMWDKARGKIL